MTFNATFEDSIVIRPEDYSQSEQLQSGVTNIILDRLDDGSGWETAFIHAKPHQNISIGQTSVGEEYFILEGALHSGENTYKAGTYLRFPTQANINLTNSITKSKIFVKRCHIPDHDRRLINIDTPSQEWHPGRVLGLEVMPLYHFEHEHTALVKWKPNTLFNPHVHPGGEEIIVIEGTFHDEFGAYPKGSWIRNKPYSKHTPFTKEDGALIYVKTGHLPPIDK